MPNSYRIQNQAHRDLPLHRNKALQAKKTQQNWSSTTDHPRKAHRKQDEPPQAIQPTGKGKTTSQFLREKGEFCHGHLH